MTAADASGARALLPLVLPALVVGTACSLLLLVVDFLSERLQEALWHGLPSLLGADGSAWPWTLAVLTATGLAVGLVLWRIPSGPDPATEELIGAPLPPGVVPGMLVAAVLSLAGGVSLGPENPVTAANVALAVALGARLLPAVGASVWLGLAVAGTVGALFGTPVAAALLLSEAVTQGGGSLWDRLFAPLVSAGAGAATTVLVASPTMSLGLADYPGARLADLVAGAVVTTCGALLGMAAVYAFPHVHRFFRLFGHPVARLTAGGLVLGLLGVLGGQITLFKGLAQMKELTADVSAYTAGGLALIVAVKTAALLVAATCAFVGGRIFPAVFTGVALGLLASALAPSVPVTLSVACGVLGIVLAITQQGWLSLFMAVAVVSDVDLLPVLCVALLPAWLVVTGRPQMVIHEPA
ncbi:ion channel protein [Streptosporangium carneum]|uniref:Ion-transport protein n=1 Tax=Streptosporangium carneum TaxID=47481 RepID=A0A9W6I6A9_9ACTN|nr:ion channel protein [Streptosporangium carneum]GLK12483.1 putative ion-transport protein [Streptosporangium carneum]